MKPNPKNFTNKINDLAKRLKAVRNELGLKGKDIAEELGVDPSSVSNWETGKATPPLNYLFFLVETYRCNIEWLLFGDDLPTSTYIPNLTAQNRQGKHIGQLLSAALDILELSNYDAAKRCNLSTQELTDLLESRTLPSFKQMEAFYLKLGLNPSYFFTGNEHWMIWPDDELLRVFIAIGLTDRTPTELLLAKIFDVDHNEASKFLKEWRISRSKGRSRALPSAWLEVLKSKYCFNPAWVHNGNPPLALPLPAKSFESLKHEDSLATEQIENLDQTALLKEVLARMDKMQEEINSLTLERKGNTVGSGAPTQKKSSAPGVSTD